MFTLRPVSGGLIFHYCKLVVAKFSYVRNQFQKYTEMWVKNVYYMYKQNISFVKLSISKAFVSDYAVGTRREYKKVAE